MTGYGIKIFSSVKETNPSCSEPEIIQKLSRHYTAEIRAAIISRPISTFNAPLEFLEKIDQTWPLNSSRYNKKIKIIIGPIIITKFPIVGISVIGATGRKSVKLKRQIYARIKIGEVVTYGVLLIIPRLMKTCILGGDILKPFGGIINLKNDMLTLDVGGKFYPVKKHDENIDYDTPRSINRSQIYKKIKESKELKKEDIQHTICESSSIDDERRLKYSNIIWKYNEIFRQRPG